jgi:membrane fusion protein, multidrug efflux system
MNIRFPSSLETVQPAQTAPGRVGGRARLIWGILGAVIVVFVAWRIFGGYLVPTPKRPPPPVVVQAVGRQDVPVVEHTIGTVVSNATVQLTARVQGQLLKAYFTEGQTVKAGDLLFQIDPGPYQDAYNSAAAMLASTKAKAERYARLLQQKAIAPQDADDARAAYLQAKANADSARLNLGYTQIHSPIDGKTGPVLIQPGNQIMAAMGASTGNTTAAALPTTLVVITQLQPVKISLSLPQADLPRIQARAAAHMLTVAIDNHAVSGGTLTAPVNFIGNAVDDKTGTIELRATFQNANNELVPGQLVDVGVTLGTLKGAKTVPHEAINLGPNSPYVYVVRQGEAFLVPVEVLHDDGTTAAIAGKIEAGEQVVIDGQLRVIPGKPVQISKPAKKPA